VAAAAAAAAEEAAAAEAAEAEAATKLFAKAAAKVAAKAEAEAEAAAAWEAKAAEEAEQAAEEEAAAASQSKIAGVQARTRGAGKPAGFAKLAGVGKHAGRAWQVLLTTSWSASRVPGLADIARHIIGCYLNLWPGRYRSPRHSMPFESLAWQMSLAKSSAIYVPGFGRHRSPCYIHALWTRLFE
jgi:hypothetical protein